MAEVANRDIVTDNGSDYGSDFTADEEEALHALLSNIPASYSAEEPFALRAYEDDESPRTARMPRTLGREQRDPKELQLAEPQEVQSSVEIESDVGTTDFQSEESRRAEYAKPVDSGLMSDVVDTRSPLERFRTAPMKALSVTDLISPSWCELQYWYTLTKHGRKRRTPAMRQGSAVHKTLEEQVHKSVAIDITVKEDAWGLRIWNVIQGLKTLRETGMTRELEIWGTIDGLVVNGVIDELSYICPDRELEAEALARHSGNKKGKNTVPEDQTSIMDFWKSGGAATLGQAMSYSRPPSSRPTAKIYLTDVKTRSSRSAPQGASFRPTLMQLMLYRRLLSDLASNKVNADLLFSRYQLDPSARFSDSFVAQIGSLNEVYYDAPSEPSQEVPDFAQDSIQMLLEHNSLQQLWALMLQEFRITMSSGAKSIGDVLKAEYRNQLDGSIIGIKTFLYDHNVLQTYLEEEIRWWKGEREAQGVIVEEAYKCRSCEFAEGCTWRKAKIDQATQRHRARSISTRQ
ncbi:MAG: hypothetical protein M1827_006844 [Pycnora praestabilis]|nr:MAG: hypothetical protein M1827_006844 [Pycnora praestabilis]